LSASAKVAVSFALCRLAAAHSPPEAEPQSSWLARSAAGAGGWGLWGDDASEPG
jgi:hypothetical protein